MHAWFQTFHVLRFAFCSSSCPNATPPSRRVCVLFCVAGTPTHIRENARLLRLAAAEEPVSLASSGGVSMRRLTDEQLARIDAMDGRVDENRQCPRWAAAGTSTHACV